MLSKSVKVLLIEDNPGDTRLVKEMLTEASGVSFDLRCAGSLSSGLQMLTTGDIELILLDMSLPDSSGMETLTMTHSSAPKVPIIILTGLDNEELALEAVRQGAQDYIVKGYTDSRSLVRAIRYAVERKLAQEGLAELEKELLKAQKLESVGLLARGLAHDFNNLLTIILSNLYFAKSFLKQEDRIFEILECAEEASGKARDLVSQLLAFAREGNIVREKVSLSHMIQEAVALSAAKGKFTFEVSLQGDLWQVKAIEGQIMRLLRNLILNAQEAMPEGGTIGIRAENITMDEDNILKLIKGEYIKLSITDNGVGIPEGNLDKIFDPYFSTKQIGTQKGMGLGLAICYSIVRNSQGLISVESKEGKGTSFSVYLPALSKPSPGD